MSNHEQQPRTLANQPWIWSGIHGASGNVHPFFASRDDPDRLYSSLGSDSPRSNYMGTDGTILASSGGLLLIKWSQGFHSLGESVADRFDPAQMLAEGYGYEEEESEESEDLDQEEENEELFEAEENEEPFEEEDNEDHFEEEGIEEPLEEIDNEEFRRLECRLEYLVNSMRLHDEEADDQSSRALEADQAQSSLKLDQHWQTLRVVNPATLEYRVLPPADSRAVGLQFWSYDGVQANLLVDTESQTYTVTLTFPECVCLYSSTSNTWAAWRCRRFNQGAPWAPHNGQLLPNPWHTHIASAYVDGRLFFADVVAEDSIPIMNLIEIDVEAGSWKLHNWHFSLQTEFTGFVDTPFRRMRGLTDNRTHQALHTRTLASRGTGVALEKFQIVECLGELYAVIPMGLDEYLPMSLRSQRTLTEVVSEYANFGLRFMPVQFSIVNMRGDGFVHGVLRVLLPEDMHRVAGEYDNIESRKYDMMEILEIPTDDPLNETLWKFSCTAEGSVIWVAFLDYVLQYDVVTGVSTTEITEVASPLEILEHGVPYRPSEMKP